MIRGTQLMPMLSVESMERALRFYRDRLGGETVYVHPPEGDPDFVVLRFGECPIGIGALARGSIHGVPLRPASGHRIELCLYVDEVDAMMALLAEDDVTVISPAADQDWGERSAFVKDPDGNIVMLTGPLPEL